MSKKKIEKRISLEGETDSLVKKFAERNGVSFSTVVEWCLSSQIFKPETKVEKAAKKIEGYIPALCLVILMAVAPACATEPVMIDPAEPVQLELRPTRPTDPPIPCIHHEQAAAIAPTVKPVKKLFKDKHPKIYKGVRKARFLLSWTAPFVNFGAAVFNFVH